MLIINRYKNDEVILFTITIIYDFTKTTCSGMCDSSSFYKYDLTLHT